MIRNHKSLSCNLFPTRCAAGRATFRTMGELQQHTLHFFARGGGGECGTQITRSVAHKKFKSGLSLLSVSGCTLETESGTDLAFWAKFHESLSLHWLCHKNLHRDHCAFVRSLDRVIQQRKRSCEKFWGFLLKCSRKYLVHVWGRHKAMQMGDKLTSVWRERSHWSSDP